jgi:hypothetical protein
VGDLVDRRVRIADLREPRRDRGNGEVLRRHRGQFLPGERGRDRRPRLRPHAVGGGDRAVAGVLVVVDEDPLAALLLPPFGGHLAGEAALQRAAEGDRRVAHLGEGPAWFDPHVDVDAAAARGLREAGVAEVIEEPAGLGRDPHRVGEVGPLLRVEVDPQLVRVVDVGIADRPGVEGDRPHLRGPGDDRELGRADLVGVAAGGEVDPRGLHPVGRALGHPLLEEGVAAAFLPGRDDDARVDALRPALERRRPVGDRPHDPLADREVVLDEVELGVLRGALGGGEDHPFRI